MQGGGEDLEAAGVGDVDAAAGFCIGTGVLSTYCFVSASGAFLQCHSWAEALPLIGSCFRYAIAADAYG